MMRTGFFTASFFCPNRVITAGDSQPDIFQITSDGVCRETGSREAGVTST